MTDQNEYVRKWKLWAPYDVRMLEDLWRAKNSASVIAEELTRLTGRYFTRNAVIGKINRLGLQGQGQLATQLTKSKKRKRITPRAPIVVTTPAVEEVLQELVSEAQEFFPEQYEEDIGLPISGRVTISDLAPGVCKYPIGDPLAADFTFCGDVCDVARPYCELHHRVAYTPITKQKQSAWRAYR